MKAYIDDIVVKSRTEDALIDDLKKMFDNLKKYRMMLNPKKCTFDVLSGKLLSFLVSNRDIEVNPRKIKTLDQMQSPRTLKEIQKLTECITTLSRFISRMDEQGMPFFKLLKKHDRFKWTEEAERAFQDLKRYLSSPLVLTPPNEKDELFLYIKATPQIISTVLVVERECPKKKAKVQRHVYYVSEVLQDSKLRYPQV